MIFTDSHAHGKIKEKTSWCIFSIKFQNKIYWFERVKITYRYFVYYSPNLERLGGEWRMHLVQVLANNFKRGYKE